LIQRDRTRRACEKNTAGSCWKSPRAIKRRHGRGLGIIPVTVSRDGSYRLPKAGKAEQEGTISVSPDAIPVDSPQWTCYARY